MRLRAALAGAAGLLTLAVPAAHAVTPSADCHGVAITDAAGDQYLGTSLNTAIRPTTAIDIREVFITGTAGNLKLNLRVGSLDANDPAVARQLTRYHVTFTNDGAQHEFIADYEVEDPNGTDTGFYRIRRVNSTFASTGRVFAEANGVIQWDMPNTLGFSTLTWPRFYSNLEAHAEQFETDADQGMAPSLRNDLASATFHTPPC